MSERSNLLKSLAETIADYREGDIEARTPQHVDRWVRQFEESAQLPILREMDLVLKRTYFSRDKTRSFMASVFQTKALCGKDPCTFWKGVKFLDIQNAGASQKAMLALFSTVLKQKCGFAVDVCGANAQAYVYLDDAIFSGGRVMQDLAPWITNDAPEKTNLHVVVVATHKGSYYRKDQVTKALRASGKKITITWWHAIKLEDQKKYTDRSDVLRPVSIPSDPEVQTYSKALKYPPHLRKAGQVGKLGIFSSDAGRQVLEQEFLKAGIRIRAMCPNLNEYQRPLGNMVLDTLGFGSLIVTFRNCPNNAPLALWVGDPWYPLFPRVTNAQTSLKHLMAVLAKELH